MADEKNTAKATVAATSPAVKSASTAKPKRNPPMAPQDPVRNPIKRTGGSYSRIKRDELTVNALRGKGEARTGTEIPDDKS